MAHGAVIGQSLETDQNAPPASQLDALYNLLHAAAWPAGSYFLINGWGEAWGVDFQTGQAWTPAAVADWCDTPGHVWVDWCGWPGYYQVQPGTNAVLTLGPSGWQQFAAAFGFPWLDAVTFDVPFNIAQPAGVFPFPRGFPLQQSLAGTAVMEGTFPGAGALGGPQAEPFTASGYASLVALVKPTGGIYVYATYTPDAGGVPATSIARLASLAVRYRTARLQGLHDSVYWTPYPAAGKPPPPGTPAPSPLTTVALVGGGALVVGGLAWWWWRTRGAAGDAGATEAGR